MKSPQIKCVRLHQERHQENLEIMLKNLLKDELLSDVTIHCKDGAVRAHRVILAASSPYFKKIFQEHPEHQVAFVIHGIAAKQMESLIELIYRGNTQVPSDMTNNLCDLAEEFGMRDIVDENDYPSGRHTRFKGQKRVAVDFENDSSDALGESPKLPRNIIERRVSSCSDRAVFKKSPSENLVNNPWASCSSLVPATLDTLGLIPTTIKQEPQSPINLTHQMSAEERRRNNWAMKQRKYKCSLCPASFKRASHLSRHQLVHTGERPYACNECDKAFSRHDKLKHHIRKTHAPEYVGNPMESPSANDFYGHMEDIDEVEKPTRITREDLLAQMPVKVEMEPEQEELKVPKMVLTIPAASPPSIVANEQSPVDLNSSGTMEGSGQKKGRGRPRKYPPIVKPLIKRPRGRPRLNQSNNSPPDSFKQQSSIDRPDNSNYDITNMPFGDLEYLTKPINLAQNQDNGSSNETEQFEECSNSMDDADMIEPLVEIEMDQVKDKDVDDDKKEEDNIQVDEEEREEAKPISAGAFLQNIGLLETSVVAKMEIGQCTVSVSGGNLPS